jgi:branched-chain amino acid transport system ATP-binding protein
MTSEPLLHINQVTRRFGGLVAVNDVSFAVEQGEIFGVIGPNGAGKTTLFNTITGLIRPSNGEIYFQNEPITQLQPFQIAERGIARTFQNIRLFGELTALENLIIAHHIHGKASFWQGIWASKHNRAEESQITDQAYNLLDLVGLTERADQKAKNLAYGDQRRLEIARALALRPRILLLDEPAAGMNHAEKKQLSAFIRDIRNRFEVTILLIEHHVPLVMGLCDRIAVLDFGQLIALGAPEVVKNDPAVIEAYLGDEV